jgi:biopolymer transport protein ExbD
MAEGRRRLRRSDFRMEATTPMIDVIFILFFFFISVTQIRKSTVKVELPEVSDPVATGDKQDEKEPLRWEILLTQDGRCGLGKETFRTREALFARIGERAAADQRTGRPIVAEIITDRQADTGPLVDLVNFLSRQGVRRLEFLAVEKGKK